MKKILFAVTALALTLSAFASSHFVLTRMESMDVDTTGVIGSAFSIAVDDFGTTTDLYVTSSDDTADSTRPVVKIADLFGTPAVSKFADVPIYMGEGPSYTEQMWILYAGMFGIAVSEDAVFAGGKTFNVNGTDASGVYIVKYDKSAAVQNVYKDTNGDHAISSMKYYKAETPVTIGLDADNNYVASDDPNVATTIQVQDSILAGQVGQGIFGINPNDMDYGDPTGSSYERGYSPVAWVSGGRSHARDIAYDPVDKDLYVGMTGSSATDPITPPGVVKVPGYDPIDINGAGGTPEELFTVPAPADFQEYSAWIGIEFYRRAGQKYIFVSDYKNTQNFCYYLDPAGATQLFDLTTELGQVRDVEVVSDGTDDYLIATGFSGIKFWKIEDEPTFSSSWSIFQ